MAVGIRICFTLLVLVISTWASGESLTDERAIKIARDFLAVFDTPAGPLFGKIDHDFAFDNRECYTVRFGTATDQTRVYVVEPGFVLQAQSELLEGAVKGKTRSGIAKFKSMSEAKEYCERIGARLAGDFSAYTYAVTQPNADWPAPPSTKGRIIRYSMNATHHGYDIVGVGATFDLDSETGHLLAYYGYWEAPPLGDLPSKLLTVDEARLKTPQGKANPEFRFDIERLAYFGFEGNVRKLSWQLAFRNVDYEIDAQTGELLDTTIYKTISGISGTEKWMTETKEGREFAKKAEAERKQTMAKKEAQRELAWKALLAKGHVPPAQLIQDVTEEDLKKRTPLPKLHKSKPKESNPMWPILAITTVVAGMVMIGVHHKFRMSR